MKTNKVLILGAYGFLGTYLSSHLVESGFQVLRQGRNLDADFKINLESKDELIIFLNTNRPNTIINLIALTDVDYCEKFPNTSFISNSKIVGNISSAIMAFELKTRFIHVSTDQVYNGDGNHSEDIVNPLNVYGITKYLGERMINSDLNRIILRTNFVAKNYLMNNSFSDWLLSSATNKNEITIFNDIFFNPLHISTLCNIISKYIINSNITGTFNLGSNNGTSKAQFALMFIEKLKITNNFIVGKSTNFNFAAKRPKNMTTNLSLFEEKFDLKLPDFKNEINKLSAQYLK